MRYKHGQSTAGQSRLAVELEEQRREIIRLRHDNEQLERQNAGLQNMHVRATARIKRLERLAAEYETTQRALAATRTRLTKARNRVEVLERQTKTLAMPAPAPMSAATPDTPEAARARLEDVTREAQHATRSGRLRERQGAM